MSLANEDYSKRRRPRNFIGYSALLISLIALVISVLTSYYNVLKPFELAIRIDPVVSIQHKGNLGLYLDVEFFNKSPKNGLITQLAFVMYKTASMEDKYLLTLHSFRVITEDGTFGDSEERLPLFFEPWERKSKVLSFIYAVEQEEFPISMGTYTCELLAWTDESIKPKYVKEFKFEISADVLSVYLDRREKGSTTLWPINIVGYTALKSKKLTDAEYRRLH